MLKWPSAISAAEALSLEIRSAIHIEDLIKSGMLTFRELQSRLMAAAKRSMSAPDACVPARSSVHKGRYVMALSNLELMNRIFMSFRTLQKK